MSVKIANEILQNFAQEERRIVSRWRCQYFLWLAGEPFADDVRALRIIRAMERMGWVEPLGEGGRRDSLFRVTAAYASAQINPFEVVMEGYHGNTLGYQTAMILHQLTDQRGQEIHLHAPSGIQGYTLASLRGQRGAAAEQILQLQLPVGTKAEAWETKEVPRFTRMNEIEGRKISEHSLQDRFLFDFEEINYQGVKVRVTSRARTLVEGLRHPSYCGGLNEIFRAWVNGIDEIQVDDIVRVTERFQSKILIQRVGLVLETLGLEHPSLAMWKKHQVQRGGSRLLDPKEPYAPQFSEDWGISINHPLDILEER